MDSSARSTSHRIQRSPRLRLCLVLAGRRSQLSQLLELLVNGVADPNLGKNWENGWNINSEMEKCMEKMDGKWMVAKRFPGSLELPWSWRHRRPLGLAAASLHGWSSPLGSELLQFPSELVRNLWNSKDLTAIEVVPWSLKQQLKQVET